MEINKEQTTNLKIEPNKVSYRHAFSFKDNHMTDTVDVIYGLEVSAYKEKKL